MRGKKRAKDTSKDAAIARGRARWVGVPLKERKKIAQMLTEARAAALERGDNPFWRRRKEQIAARQRYLDELKRIE